MATYRLTIAYDGGEFAGWARQPGLRTVQQTVEEGIEQILGGRSRVRLVVAGRTDAGVHASAQVASFELDSEMPDAMATRINAVLPRDVSVLAFEPAPDGFDARRWATSRSYRYLILIAPQPDPFLQGRALWYPRPLDGAALDACARAIEGRHDFTAFTKAQTQHVHFDRVVTQAGWQLDSDGRMLSFTITADAFMRSMIRVLVGTMLEIGRGKRTVEDLEVLLEGAPRERAGETAPAHGLYFTGVTFGDGPAFVYPAERGGGEDVSE